VTWVWTGSVVSRAVGDEGDRWLGKIINFTILVLHNILTSVQCWNKSTLEFHLLTKLKVLLYILQYTTIILYIKVLFYI
jgi:hypothetical protein